MCTLQCSTTISFLVLMLFHCNRTNEDKTGFNTRLSYLFSRMSPLGCVVHRKKAERMTRTNQPTRHMFKLQCQIKSSLNVHCMLLSHWRGYISNWTLLFLAKHRIGSRYNNVIHNNRKITRRISNNAFDIDDVTVANGIWTIAALRVYILYVSVWVCFRLRAKSLYSFSFFWYKI